MPGRAPSPGSLDQLLSGRPPVLRADEVPRGVGVWTTMTILEPRTPITWLGSEERTSEFFDSSAKTCPSIALPAASRARLASARRSRSPHRSSQLEVGLDHEDLVGLFHHAVIDRDPLDFSVLPRTGSTAACW